MLWNVGFECECHGDRLGRLRDETEGVVWDPGFGGVVGPPGVDEAPCLGSPQRREGWGWPRPAVRFHLESRSRLS